MGELSACHGCRDWYTVRICAGTGVAICNMDQYSLAVCASMHSNRHTLSLLARPKGDRKYEGAAIMVV